MASRTACGGILPPPCPPRRRRGSGTRPGRPRAGSAGLPPGGRRSLSKLELAGFEAQRGRDINAGGEGTGAEHVARGGIIISLLWSLKLAILTSTQRHRQPKEAGWKGRKGGGKDLLRSRNLGYQQTFHPPLDSGRRHGRDSCSAAGCVLSAVAAYSYKNYHFFARGEVVLFAPFCNSSGARAGTSECDARKAQSQRSGEGSLQRIQSEDELNVVMLRLQTQRRLRVNQEATEAASPCCWNCHTKASGS